MGNLASISRRSQSKKSATGNQLDTTSHFIRLGDGHYPKHMKTEVTGRKTSRSAQQLHMAETWPEEFELASRPSSSDGKKSLWGKLRKWTNKTDDAFWDEDKFLLQMHDFLTEKNLETASAEYTRLTKGSFEKFFHGYLNDELKRAVIFRFNHYVFSWVNEHYVRRQLEIAEATKEQVQENQDVLRSLIEERVLWPTPYQGVRTARGIPVNVIYCGLNPKDVTCWQQQPQNCRVSLVYGNLYYKGFVW
eukprot:CAMPEP_0117665450 /NCGR_PEP_ID=MMETSP0804-20121206/9816_1 /TAXON_ID=1074897 /ORGANISM="Tetraselmis astigmatica, Strain CCMP880" /LENGTH=247 /DNA_ID=CAMNT_0005472863 /DNA_START=108 /DNA_END=848 /DNA_ORIENTATION=+